MCIVSSKCIVTSIVLATTVFLLFLAEHYREYKIKNFVELTLNESHIEEQILLDINYIFHSQNFSIRLNFFKHRLKEPKNYDINYYI